MNTAGHRPLLRPIFYFANTQLMRITTITRLRNRALTHIGPTRLQFMGKKAKAVLYADSTPCNARFAALTRSLLHTTNVSSHHWNSSDVIITLGIHTSVSFHGTTAVVVVVDW